mgnify:CR=1 FL=1
MHGWPGESGAAMASDGQNGGRRFDRPRIGAALTLIAVSVGLLLLDPFMPEYTLSDVQLSLLLGVAATLLGVEVADFLRRGR